MNTKILFVPLLILTLGSCGNNKDRSAAALKFLPPVLAEDTTAAIAVDYEDVAFETSYSPSNKAEIIKTSPMIIRTADVRFQVKDIKKAAILIKKAVSANKASISNASENNDTYNLENTFTIRVPAAIFDTLLTQLDAFSVYTNYKNIHSDDVTEDYMDVATRLKVRRKVEERYLELLKNAKKMDDILAVENQLRNIREEIETAEGRIKYLSNQVAYSTITLNFYQTLSQPEYAAVGFGERLLTAFVNGWNSFLSFIVGLIDIWPFIFIISVVAWLLKKWWKAFRAKKKEQQV